MFKYTFECNGILPPINLKLPQMSTNHKSSTISSEKKVLQPKQILFDDTKKSDLFDCEFGEDEDGISVQNQDRFDMENAGE